MVIATIRIRNGPSLIETSIGGWKEIDLVERIGYIREGQIEFLSATGEPVATREALKILRGHA